MTKAPCLICNGTGPKKEAHHDYCAACVAKIIAREGK